MIVVHLKFWIMILKVLLLNLEYKWEQFNDFHFSSKMKHMWNPDCDLAVKVIKLMCKKHISGTMKPTQSRYKITLVRVDLGTS